MSYCRFTGSNAISSGSMSQKTHFQRSAKGPIALSAAEPNGLWVEVENTGRKDENLTGWRIARKVNHPHHNSARRSKSA